MKGLFVIKCDEILKEDPNNPNDDLKLLLHRDTLEVMIQHISTDSAVWIDPAEDKDTIEFYYVLSGILQVGSSDVDDNKILKPGDSFYTTNIEKQVLVRIIEDTDLFYVTNKPLYQEIQDYQTNLSMFIKKINERDRYTKEHSNRVKVYVEVLCKPLSKKYKIDYEALTVASLFHDIGKCSLPDELLKSEILLSEKEKEQYRNHVEYGRVLVNNYCNEKISHLVLCHHELLDGSGYLGYRGDDLSIEARILIVANAFDLMTSFKEICNPKLFLYAAKELNSMKDKYDSDVTDALVELINVGKLA